MTMLTIGTGVGGAIVSGGPLFRGGFGAARRARPPARRARRAALRLRCARLHRAVRLGSRAAAHGERDRRCRRHRPSARPSASEHGGTQRRHRRELIADDDPGAVAALRELGRWLGQACASLSAVLDPQLFVFGGGVAVAGDLLLDPVRESFLASTFRRAATTPSRSSRSPSW